MRILVFQQAAWDSTNSVGNTQSNWFGDWDDVFFNFYTRKQIPDNAIVSEYYSISALDLIKEKLLLKKNTHRFSAYDVSVFSTGIETQKVNEQKAIDKLHKAPNDFIYWAMETTWRSGLWLDTAFKKFVEDSDPDIFFAFCTSTYILAPLITYLKENTRAKVVLYIADDVYGDYSRKPFFRRNPLMKEFRRCIEMADLLYGASKPLCEKYEGLFSKPVNPLYKGCEFETITEKHNTPLKIVYAGNLMYGRDDTLSKLSRCIARINAKCPRLVLEIYTASPISCETREKLEYPNSATIMGKRSYKEIMRIMSQADVVLHVESFEPQQIESVKYSFSTKIIDCLQSGALTMAIGPENIASIEYIREIPGTIVIDNLDNLDSSLEDLLTNWGNKAQKVAMTRSFAIENHDLSIVREKIKKDFYSLLM